MFRFHKTLDVITLFHKPASTTSIQALRLLKRVSAAASGAVTGVAEDDDVKYKVRREEFELNVTEDPPTTDQLRNILEYVGARRAGDLVTGARDEAEAMRKLKENGENFQRPVIVDWNNGTAVVGGNESEILRMLQSAS